MRALDAIIAEPWAITEEALEVILDIAGREVEAPDVEALQQKFAEKFEAVEAFRGRRLAGTDRVTVRDGVAVVPIAGPIFRYANLFTEISGATSIEKTARDFQAAFDAPDVSGVIVTIDSPGGTVNGTNELGKIIKGAADAGTKPVVAYVSGVGASAAYWLASSTQRIFLDDTAQVGSIGVVMAGMDTRDRDRARGIREIKIVSSQSPRKQPDPSTDEGLAVLQARVDRLANIFIGRIAENRGVSRDKVESEFGRGDVLIGADAVGAGMADEIATFESLVARMAAGEIQASPRGRGRTSAKESTVMSDITTVAGLRSAFPDLVGRIEEEVRADATAAAEANKPAITVDTIKNDHPAIAAALTAEGQAAERTRIKDLEAAALPGFEKILEECKADGKSTAADLAVKIIAAQKQQGSAALGELRGDDQAGDKAPPAPGASAAGDQGQAAANAGGQPAADWRAEAEKQWEADAALRKDFGDSKDAYLAYAEANAEGRVRMYQGQPAAV